MRCSDFLSSSSAAPIWIFKGAQTEKDKKQMYTIVRMYVYTHAGGGRAINIIIASPSGRCRRLARNLFSPRGSERNDDEDDFEFNSIFLGPRDAAVGAIEFTPASRLLRRLGTRARERIPYTYIHSAAAA